MSRARIPTQQDIRERGECGSGYRPSDGRHCGQPSEPGATFGDCPEHAAGFREQVREVDRAERRIESADAIERGYRAIGAERWENKGSTAERQREIAGRAREARPQARVARTRSPR